MPPEQELDVNEDLVKELPGVERELVNMYRQGVRDGVELGVELAESRLREKTTE